LLGLWLLVPEHLRLGTWDLLRTWSGELAQESLAPRLALHLVHEAALCRSTLRAERSLRHRGFELANGLPWLPTDNVLHDLLEAHTVAQAQQLQIGLGKLRRASGHFPGQVLALDPHRLVSYSQRDMVQRRPSAAEPATKQAQTFFLLDAHTRQPLCLTNASSARSLSSATQELLGLAQQILPPPAGQRPLIVADVEHFTVELFDYVLKTYETLGLLKSKLEVRPVRSATLIEIRVSSDKPEEAARIANAVAEEYKALRHQRFTRSRQEGLRALEDRFREQEEKVKKAGQMTDKLRVELNITDALAREESPSPLMTAETLRELESLRIESQAEYVRQATMFERLKALQKELGPEGLAPAMSTAAPDAVLSSYIEHLGAAEQQLAGLSKEYGPQHVEVLKIKSQIEDLHDKIRTRVEGAMLGLDARVLSLSNSLDNLNKEIALAITNDVVRANESQQYFEAKRNLEELQRFRHILKMKVASERIDLGFPKMAMVEVVDRAAPAARPVSPNLTRALTLILSGALLDIAGFMMLARRPGAASEPLSA